MTKKKPREIRIHQIVDAAVHEFIEKGYHGASMQSIAGRAGLSKGALYHHFKGKDDILIAANNRYMEPIFKMMAQARDSKSPVQGLKSFISNYIRYWSEHPKEIEFFFLSMAKISSTREMWHEIDDYLQLMVGFYEGLLLQGIRCGELHRHDYQSRSMALFSSLDGIIGYVVMCEHLAAEKAADQMINVFIDDIET